MKTLHIIAACALAAGMAAGAKKDNDNRNVKRDVMSRLFENVNDAVNALKIVQRQCGTYADKQGITQVVVLAVALNTSVKIRQQKISLVSNTLAGVTGGNLAVNPLMVCKDCGYMSDNAMLKACPICKNSGRKFICISVLELRNSRKSNKVLFGE